MYSLEGAETRKTLHSLLEPDIRPAHGPACGPRVLTTHSELGAGTRGPRPSGPKPSGGEARGKAATNMWDLAIWTYRAQQAHRDSGRVGGIGYGSTSQTGAVLDRARLGCSISGGGGLSRTYCDDDALSVHEMVLRLRGHERALVIGSASTASVPGWAPAIPDYRVVPVKGRKGAVKGIYDRHGNQIGCEIDYVGFAPDRAADVVRHARQVYAAWYSALAVLRDALAALDELRRWVVTGVGAEPTPWRG